MLNDNEIIKALECLMHDNCEDCPYYRDDCADRIKDPIELSKYALDLINQQQAEIDEMKHEREVLIEDIHCSADKINEQREEIEKLERTISYLEGVCESTPDKVRAEAIKEFAERLKNIYIKDKRYDRPNAHTLIDWLFANIDNLVKEMMGEQ